MNEINTETSRDHNLTNQWKATVINKYLVDNHIYCDISNQPLNIQRKTTSTGKIEIIDADDARFHHIESVDIKPDKQYDENNGVILRADIHNLFHQCYGFGKNTRQQYLDFKKQYTEFIQNKIVDTLIKQKIKEQQLNIKYEMTHKHINEEQKGYRYTIEPLEASYLLTNFNKNNRKITTSRIEKYKDAIINNEWKLSPIIFHKNGNLLDGQHRLLACNEAKMPITVMVLTGYEDKDIDGIDMGLARKLPHILNMQNGFDDADQLYGIVITYYRKIKGTEHSFLASAKTCNAEHKLNINNLYKENRETVKDIYDLCNKCRYLKPMGVKSALFEFYLKYGLEEVKLIIELLENQNGPDWNAKHPLRRLIDELQKKKGGGESRIRNDYFDVLGGLKSYKNGIKSLTRFNQASYL